VPNLVYRAAKGGAATCFWLGLLKLGLISGAVLAASVQALVH